MNLNPGLEKRLNEAVQYALERKHEFVSLEHVLLALTHDSEVSEIITGCGGNLHVLRKKLRQFLDEHCPKVTVSDDLLRTEDPAWKPAFTFAFQRVIQRAVLQVHSADRSEVSGGHLLIALLKEEESHAVHFLEQQGVTRFEAVQFYSHGAHEPQESQPEESEFEPSRQKPKTSPLKAYTLNLNERAEAGLIDPLVGREDVLDRALQILSRRTKNNVLLVGEPGVGKTAIVEGLALRFFENRVPEPLKGTVIYSLDLGALVAGTRYRGDFEARLKSVVKALEACPKAVLFIDEMHTLIGAGSTGGNAMDASNLLKPSLVNRTLSCIGSTTFKEFRYLEKDQALIRRFQRVDVKAPSAEETLKILKSLKPRYESFHGIRYTDQGLQAAVDLSGRYLHSRPFPDKALDVLDEAGARNRLKENAKDAVDVPEIEHVVASMAQTPLPKVSSDDRERLFTLETDLKGVIFGQDNAIHALVSSIKMARAGLGNQRKPIGCYLFTGPTGVGKTELCRQTARLLSTELLRFDMSEYMEKHTVSRLVGAPPGYVGYDEGGLLTEAVFKNPYAVLLLDEIEKAHPDITNLLLQIMDSGQLTDPNGKTVNFRNVMLVMTSNAGAREMSKHSMGILPGETKKSKSLAAIRSQFSPEFINRLDAIIPFSELAKETVMHIIDKFLLELAEQLREKSTSLEIDPSVREWIFEKGYDITYGARPLQRTVAEHLKKPLVDELLFGRLASGGHVKVAVKDDALTFSS